MPPVSPSSNLSSKTSSDRGSIEVADLLHDILTNHVIHWNIFSYCTPQTLLRFERTCRLAQAIVEDYIRVAFNIDARLSPFFDDPRAFRSLQARTGTVISGSTALQFFERAIYPGTGMTFRCLLRESTVKPST